MTHAATLPPPDAAPRAIGTVRHFARHQTIFAEGEPAAHVMRIIHGMVRSCSSFSDGRRFVGAFYADGDIFGLERNPTYLASAEAVCKTVIILYKAPEWFDICRAQDSFSRQILGAMLLNNDQARSHARLLGRLSAIEKTSAFLLECHDRANQNPIINLEMTRQDIADYLGLTVETVSRCLSRLKQDGLIAIRSSRQLNLLDLPTLRAIST